MLRWFVTSITANEALQNGYIIQPKDIACTPWSLASGALDSLATIRWLRDYFSREAWNAVQETGLTILHKNL